MDKKTFISELKQALSVLQEEELEDIVSEYEQHIDMKQKNGLTEEDIADFGSLNELSAEILQAYHVRADYASGSKQGKNLFFSSEKEIEEIFQQTKRIGARAGGSVMSGMYCLGNILWSMLLFCKKQAARPFVWLKRKWEGQKNMEAFSSAIQERGADFPLGRNHTSRRKSVYRGAGTLLSRAVWLMCNLCHLAGRIFLWGIRTMWNVGWVCFALFCGGCGLFSLYMLGMLTVLLMQRYPLAGVTLGCLGLVLCFFSAAGLGMTFLWRKKNMEEIRGGLDAGGSRPKGYGKNSGKMEKHGKIEETERTEGEEHA